MKLAKIFFAIFIIFSINLFAKGMPSEYYAIKDTKKVKAYFSEYIYKLTKKENLKILEERSFIKNLLSSSEIKTTINKKQLKKLTELKKRYRVKNLYDLKSYMMKIDVIPPSMSIAQAAVESAWGKSRFTKKANNIFGHWTYNSKNGIVPKRRTAGSKHLIRVFKNLQDSLSAYMLNLNRHTAYKSFREKRYQTRMKNKHPMGLELSQTMTKYSGIGKKYLSILKSVIKKNKLETYDKRFYQEN
jgi:Bax protein